MNSTPDKPFEIVFEDQHLLVLSKAAGILSQGDESGDESMVELLRKYVGRNYVGVVHRLDRNTSGLMVFGKRSKATDRLAESLRRGDLHRAYLAIVSGEIPAKFEWRDSLLKNEATNTVKVVKENTQGAKEAILSGERLESKKGFSLAKFVLETGRSHQIRVQASSRGFSLVGDTKYGKAFGLSRLALHSCFIEFPHPMDESNILRFESGLPSELQQYWEKL